MKISILTYGILAFCFFACAGTKKMNRFEGTWVWLNGEPNYKFSINISTVTDSNLHGGYCGYPADLSKIDCGNEDDEYCKITGKVTESDTVRLKFKSCYSGMKGEAILIYLGADSLRWVTTENFSDNLSSWNGVVNEAILVRCKSK